MLQTSVWACRVMCKVKFDLSWMFQLFLSFRILPTPSQGQMMSSSTVYTSPYENLTGTWIRGSFHGHCSENSSCGRIPLAEGVQMYHEVGAGFVTLTDHDYITDLTDIAPQYPDMTFIQGFEYSTRENVVFAGPGVKPLYEVSLEAALQEAKDLLTFVAHPKRWVDREYWTLPMLEALGTWPDGLEVYNGHYGIERALAEGRWPLYNDFWDEVLTAGHRVWGYANDDFHELDDFSNAFNMVNVLERTPEGVIAAAKAGRCYATTGPLVAQVTVAENTYSVDLEKPASGRFVGLGGVVLEASEGTAFSYLATDEPYVRFEAEGSDGRVFLQPMYGESFGG